MNLARIADTAPADSLALVAGARTWTYAELRRDVALARETFAVLDLAAGDRVGLLAANNPAFVVGFLAAVADGFVVVPLSPQSPPAELARELKVTRTTVLLVDDADARSIKAEHLGIDSVVPIPVGGSRSAKFHPVVERDRDDPAVLLFTSGTAGPPAAAVLSHANLMANLTQVAAHPGAAIVPNDVVLAIAPLCHVLGLNAVLLPALAAGATVVLIEHFTPDIVLSAIVDHGVTVVSGPPALWDSLAKACTDPSIFATVRMAISGAAPLTLRTVDAVAERCGVRLQQGYGLTEASPVVTLAVGTAAPATSVGIPIPGVEVRIVDNDGTDVLIGDEGELWVRGPNVFIEYFDDREASARVRAPGGWLRTGDVAVVDDRGWISIVDRAKALIIVSGFNVHPGEVERVLLAHPAVTEAVVVGVANVSTGERIEAAVVLSDHAVTTDDLLEHCRKNLARYKVPAVVRVVNELPHGLTGKVLRRSLNPNEGR